MPHPLAVGIMSQVWRRGRRPLPIMPLTAGGDWERASAPLPEFQNSFSDYNWAATSGMKHLPITYEMCPVSLAVLTGKSVKIALLPGSLRLNTLPRVASPTCQAINQMQQIGSAQWLSSLLASLSDEDRLILAARLLPQILPQCFSSCTPEVDGARLLALPTICSDALARQCRTFAGRTVRTHACQCPTASRQ